VLLGLRQINTCRKVPLQVNFALVSIKLTGGGEGGEGG
jgi:hypothetical protein